MYNFDTCSQKCYNFNAFGQHKRKFSTDDEYILILCYFDALKNHLTNYILQNVHLNYTTLWNCVLYIVNFFSN